MVRTPLPHRLRKSLDQNELIQELEAPKFSQTINDAEWKLIATRYKNKFPEDASLIEWQAIKKYIINKKKYIKKVQKRSEKTTKTLENPSQTLENPSHSVSPTQPAPPIQPSSPIPSTSTSHPSFTNPGSDSQIPYLTDNEYHNFMDSL